jgi:hypothetical protein
VSARRAILAAGAATLALPAPAHAHGLVQRADLPIPEWLFGWAAAVVLIVSFVALAVLWRRPQLEGEAAQATRPLFAARGDLACQAIGLGLLVLVLVAGFAGENSPQGNLAPTFVFVVFWVGLVFASLLLGDVFHAFNPWRALGRVLRLEARRPYPERLGRWPAALGLFAFAWLELAAGDGEEPLHIAIATAVYTVLTLGAMAVYGVEPWLRRGEAFSVYFGLFARASPVHTRDGVVALRRPLSGLPALEPAAGTVALLAVMIGTVTFDGLSSGSLWDDASAKLDGGWETLGLSVDTGLSLSATLGMIGCVLAVAGFYRLGIAGARTVGGGLPADRLANAFVHSLVPIAVVYVVAHYLTLLVFQGQAAVYLASDPLGRDWDLFGTATVAIDYGVLSQNATWYLQVGFVVAGHVAALALAHDRALVLYDDARRATRSQYWMLGVMVGFTTLALWLLAQAGS